MHRVTASLATFHFRWDRGCNFSQKSGDFDDSITYDVFKTSDITEPEDRTLIYKTDTIDSLSLIHI